MSVLKFADMLMRYLLRGIQNTEEHYICIVLHNHFHIFHVILGLNYVHILNGSGTTS